jgi:hypothetical protein
MVQCLAQTMEVLQADAQSRWPGGAVPNEWLNVGERLYFAAICN